MKHITQNTAEEINRRAKECGESYAENDVSKSQLRQIYGVVRGAKNELEHEGGLEQAQGTLQLLKPKLAYAASKKDEMKEVRDDVLDLMDEYEVFKGGEAQLAEFFEIMEAIVAYHEYYGED